MTLFYPFQTIPSHERPGRRPESGIKETGASRPVRRGEDALVGVHEGRQRPQGRVRWVRVLGRSGKGGGGLLRAPYRRQGPHGLHPRDRGLRSDESGTRHAHEGRGRHVHRPGRLCIVPLGADHLRLPRVSGGGRVHEGLRHQGQDRVQRWRVPDNPLPRGKGGMRRLFRYGRRLGQDHKGRGLEKEGQVPRQSSFGLT